MPELTHANRLTKRMRPALTYLHIDSTCHVGFLLAVAMRAFAHGRVGFPSNLSKISNLGEFAEPFIHQIYHGGGNNNNLTVDYSSYIIDKEDIAKGVKEMESQQQKLIDDGLVTDKWNEEAQPDECPSASAASVAMVQEEEDDATEMTLVVHASNEDEDFSSSTLVASKPHKPMTWQELARQPQVVQTEAEAESEKEEEDEPRVQERKSHRRRQTEEEEE
jgi:hypothetical protein